VAVVAQTITQQFTMVLVVAVVERLVGRTRRIMATWLQQLAVYQTQVQVQAQETIHKHRVQAVQVL
jgi:hypothetical protein